MRLLSHLIGARRQLRRLGQADHDELLKALYQWPAPSAFLLGWLHRFGMSGTRHNAFFDVYVIGPHGDWRLVALVVPGALIAIAHGGAEEGAELGAHLRASGAEFQTVVGPEAAVEGVVEALMPRDFVPRVAQAQRLMARHRDDAPIVVGPEAAGLALRTAVHADLEKLGDASLAMHEEEVGKPNSASDVDALLRATHQKVREGRVWVLTDDNEDLLFKASSSLPTLQVTQIEGVWTRPDARGRGLAHGCLQRICEELFVGYSVLALTVGAENHAALRLYERLHFCEVMPWRTVYLDQ